jgi:hypothetical protein
MAGRARMIGPLLMTGADINVDARPRFTRPPY